MRMLVFEMSVFPFDLPTSGTSAGHARVTAEGLPPSLSASGPSLTIEPPADNRAKDKAHVRAVRQRLIEEEQRREEEAALHMTDEEREILEQCFASVKTEFADLDGLSWSTQPPGISLGLGLGIRRAASPDENAGMVRNCSATLPIN
ncbi:hypothetical protein EWM64_g8489 [Hericium alpestre]|uniref:Uncharacterized protein n=1 Tax=Hericium alpestre TaxID=135208 RepID=A0A4Y9ZNE9_9AGAM|nr:hypothetical protein EWM64_g8489 [Hericium alpestre]